MDWTVIGEIVAILGFISSVVFGIIQIRQGNKKNSPPRLSEAQKDDENRQQVLGRISDLIQNSEFIGNVRKVKDVKDALPEQSVYSLAIRSHIHKQLLDIAILVRDGFAGISYPGRILQMSFPITNLLGALPNLIDARSPQKLETAITDFFEITEPNIYGITIPSEEYQVVLQTGGYIIDRLEKIEKLLQEKRQNGLDMTSFVESELR